MGHIFMVKLFKVEQTGRESLHSLMVLIFRESGKMISHMVMENIKHQMAKFTKVVFNMESNLEKENYSLMKDCMKDLSRIIPSMAREL